MPRVFHDSSFSDPSADGKPEMSQELSFLCELEHTVVLS